ncbi:MAG: exopolysaccharide biosynthesis polyprenyl glycosylphosphotransferase [Acidobacteriia bacterium]|nr:exopolysaccharide biosynthesis polyprenyl glycosylphosphotransferase [Terriglobia bacterium]
MTSEIPILPYGVIERSPAFRPECEAPPLAAEPLQFRERRSVPWLMAVADVYAAQAALALGLLVRRLAAPWLTHTIGPASYRGIVLGLFALPLVNWLMGLYPGYGLGAVERLRRRVIAAAVAFAGLVVWDTLVLNGGWSRAIELSTFSFALVLSPLVEVTVVTILMRCRCWGTPVFVLSSDNAGCRLVESLQRKRELGLVPIGLLKDLPEMWGVTVAGVPVVGPLSAAPALARYARTAVVAMPSFHLRRLPAFLETLPFPRVVFVPDIPGMQSLWTTARDLGGTLGIEFRRNLLLRRNYYLKRVVDYALTVPFFLASVPVIALFALWIKRVSPGPAFYRQEREGCRGRKIRVWKLRTMYADAEQVLARYLDENPRERDHWNRFFKLEHDPRILPGVGRLLRKTSLDELPQLWNTLKGEMSLVGPRPFPVYHMDAFGAEFRHLRQSVPPGLTGFWQVSERSDADLKVQEHLDTYYIRNWSLWLDAYILARTVKTVLMPRGAY